MRAPPLPLSQSKRARAHHGRAHWDYCRRSSTDHASNSSLTRWHFSRPPLAAAHRHAFPISMCRGATPSGQHRDRPLLAVAAAVIIITACARPAGGTDTVNGETVCRLVGGEGGALVCTGWANGDAFSWTRPNVTVGRGELWLPRPALPSGAGSIALLDLAGAGIRSLIPMSFEVCRSACVLDL